MRNLFPSLIFSVSFFLVISFKSVPASASGETLAPCLRKPCVWDSTDSRVDIIDDRDGLVASYLSLLLSESQKANEIKWLSEIEAFEHSTAKPLMAHEFVAARTNYSLGFSPANLTCLLRRPGPFSNFTMVTSANIENVLPEKIDVAILNNTLEVRCGYYVRASIWLNGSITYEAQDAGDMLHAHHAPSAVFLQNSPFSLSNKFLFDPTLYKKRNGTWSEIKTPPFYRAGGENLGSFFRAGNETYAAVRFNVPYSPSMASGMGYRSMGVYKISINDSSADADVHLDVSARAWISSDHCVSVCKLEQKQKLCDDLTHLAVNASTYTRCEKAALAVIGTQDIFPSMEKCLIESIVTSPASDCARKKRDQFVRLVRCAHECRFFNQIYQAGISSINGRLYTVFGRAFYHGGDETPPQSNPIHFCALSKDFVWDKDCFEKDSMMFSDRFGTYEHPLVSSMVHIDGRYALVTPAASSSESNCSVYLRQWDESNFSFVQVKKQKTTGQIVLKKFRLPTSGKVSVICQSSVSGKHCAEGLQLSGVPSATCPQNNPCLSSKTNVSDYKPGFVKVDFNVACGCAATSPIQLTIDFRDWHKIYALM